MCYVQIEDRPIVKEVKTYVREHHPVEKEFVVETRPTGMSCSPNMSSETCLPVALSVIFASMLIFDRQHFQCDL